MNSIIKQTLIDCAVVLTLLCAAVALPTALADTGLQLDGTLTTPAMVNNSAVGMFIIDTGSTYAVVTPELAQKLNIQVDDSTPRERIITANGMQVCPRVTLSSIRIGQVEVFNVPAVIKYIDDDPMLSGLLGMSFLSQVEVRIKKGKLSIQKAGE